MDEEVRKLRSTIKRVTAIFVTVALLLTGLFFYAFIQLKDKESRLESYTKKLGGAPVISNDYPLQNTDQVKLEKRDNGYVIVINDGKDSGLDADLLDGQDSTFYQNADNIISGEISPERYSAWEDLSAEGVVENGKIKADFLSVTGGSSIDTSTFATKVWVTGQGFLKTFTETDPGLVSWMGSSNIGMVGTITSGTWNGTPITSTYIADGTIQLSDLAQNSCTDGQVMKWSNTTSAWVCAVDDAVSGTVDWSTITNRPAGLDDGDDDTILTEGQVETYITNGALNLAVGTTLNTQAIATQPWVSSQGYLTSYTETDPTLATWAGSTNITTVGTVISGTWNGTPITSAYIADGTVQFADIAQNGCVAGETMKWSGVTNAWQCSLDQVLTEAQVETYITNGSVNLATGSTVNGGLIATQPWVSSQGYLTSYTETDPTLAVWTGSTNIATVGTVTNGTWNGTPITSTYIQNGTIQFADIGQNACTNGQVMQWNGTSNTWQCASVGTGSATNNYYGSINIAVGRSYTKSPAPSGFYPDDQGFDANGSGTWIASGELTNNVVPTISYSDAGWSGWDSVAAQITVDLGALSTADQVRITGLGGSANIGRPTYYQIEYSDDNSSWTILETRSGMASGGQPGASYWLLTSDISASGAHRYWRVTVDSDYQWVFLGEFEILRYAEGITSVDWVDIQNRPAGLDDGDDVLSEGQVESYITNAPINLATGSTVNGATIASETWVAAQGYLTSYTETDPTLATWTGSSNIATVGTITSGTWNGAAITSSYIADGTITFADVAQNGCTDGQVMKWNGTANAWQCAVDENTGTGGGSTGTATGVYDMWDTNAPPATPSSYDDEFEGTTFNTGLWQEYDPYNFQTITQSAGNANLAQASDAADDVTGIYQSIPAGDFTIDTKVQMVGGYLNYDYFGLALWEDPSNPASRIVSNALLTINSSLEARVSLWTNASTFGSHYSGSNVAGQTSAIFRIRRTGTTYVFSYSQDGISWIRLHQGTLPFTPAAFGIMVSDYSGINAVNKVAYFRYKNVDVGANTPVEGQLIAVGNVAPVYSKWDPDAPPVTASASDDEFSGTTLDSGWTEFDYGNTMATSFLNGKLRLTDSTHAPAVQGLSRPIPVGDFSIVTKIEPKALRTNYLFTGLSLYENSADSSKQVYTFHLVTGASENAVQLHLWNSWNSWNNVIANNTDSYIMSSGYLRIRRTGTIYYFDYSEDGLGWMQLYESTLTFVPQQMGLFINNQNTGASSLSSDFEFFRYKNSNVGIHGQIDGQMISIGGSGGSTGSGTVDWTDIQNRPAGLDDGDDVLSEAQVETYVTNGALNLATGTTLNGVALATETWVAAQGYLTSYTETDPTLATWAGTSNITTVGTITSGTWNGSAITSTYIQDGTISLADLGQNGCTDGQVIKWNAVGNAWQCADDNNSGTGGGAGVDGYVYQFDSAAVNDGVDSNRVTGSAYAYQRAVLRLTTPMYVQKFLVDINGAGTYSLEVTGFVDGQYQVIETISGVVVSGATTDVEFVLTTPKIVTSLMDIKLTRQEGTIAFADNSALGDYWGTLYNTDGVYYATSFFGQYLMPVRIVAIPGVLELGGSASTWTDNTTYLLPLAARTLGSSTSGDTNKLPSLYLGDASTLVFGTDNDVVFSFTGSVLNAGSGLWVMDVANSRVGINNSNPAYTLDVGGIVNASQFCINGDCIASWPTGGAQSVSWSRASGTTDESYAVAAWADMPDMTITKTTGDTAVEMTFSAGVGNNTNGGITRYRLLVDGVVVGSETKTRVPTTSVGSTTNLSWITNVTAGSHTFKVQWYSEVGTSYNRPASGLEHRTLIVKEFLGSADMGTGQTFTGNIVQQATAGQNTTILTITLTSTPTEGNKLIALLGNTGGRTLTVTQTGVTWTKAINYINGSPAADVWIGTVGAGAGTAVTVTGSGAAYIGGNVSEWTGLTGTVVQAIANGGAKNIATSPQIKATAGNLVVGVVSMNGGGTLEAHLGGTKLNPGGNWVFPAYAMPLTEHQQFLWYGGSGPNANAIVEIQ